MSRLVDHARRELIRCGQWDEDPAYSQSLLAAIAAFCTFGHSGGSQGMAVAQLTALLAGETLTPLTNDPDEWEDRSAISGVPMWQNNRNSAAISYDHGLTYQLMTDTDGDATVYTSAPAHQAAQASPYSRPDPPVRPTTCDPAPPAVDAWLSNTATGAAAIRFTGTGDSCTAVTAFLGGPAAAGHRWKSRTYDGGWVDTPDGEVEFTPGDWIARSPAGEFHVLRPASAAPDAPTAPGHPAGPDSAGSASPADTAPATGQVSP